MFLYNYTVYSCSKSSSKNNFHIINAMLHGFAADAENLLLMLRVWSCVTGRRNRRRIQQPSFMHWKLMTKICVVLKPTSTLWTAQVHLQAVAQMTNWASHSMRVNLSVSAHKLPMPSLNIPNWPINCQRVLLRMQLVLPLLVCLTFLSYLSCCDLKHSILALDSIYA